MRVLLRDNGPASSSAVQLGRLWKRLIRAKKGEVVQLQCRYQTTLSLLSVLDQLAQMLVLDDAAHLGTHGGIVDIKALVATADLDDELNATELVAVFLGEFGQANRFGGAV